MSVARKVPGASVPRDPLSEVDSSLVAVLEETRVLASNLVDSTRAEKGGSKRKRALAAERKTIRALSQEELLAFSCVLDAAIEEVLDAHKDILVGKPSN